MVEVVDKSGVFRISFISCGASYIGQCGRKLRRRCYEHLTDNFSEMFGHIVKEGHD